MAKIDKKLLLESIKNISNLTLESKILFEGKDGKNIDGDIKIVSEYFKTDRIETILVSIIFMNNLHFGGIDIMDIAKHFNRSPIDILMYSDNIKSLITKNILTLEKSYRSNKTRIYREVLYISSKIMEAIINSESLPNIVKPDFENIYELFEYLMELAEESTENQIEKNELLNRTKIIIKDHQRFSLIHHIGKMDLSIENTYIYLFLIGKNISGSNNTDLKHVLNAIFVKNIEKTKYTQSLLSGENKLVQLELVEVMQGGFISDLEIQPTKKSQQLLKHHNIYILADCIKKDNVISPQKINHKKLIFNEDQRKQIESLQSILQANHFANIQKKMKLKGIAIGVTALFYGLPGTGKTETVYQLAKSTGREIIVVDLSNTKSKWFGDTEKITKKIFDEYREFCKKNNTTPILLINEADGIISTRKTHGNSNTQQTENTVQNIILEELEKFTGILIATTNLAVNMDSAFERRFLFKINFEVPAAEARAKIWKSKFIKLSINRCKTLAGKYNFTGSQMENVLRKCEIAEIIHGKKITFDEIIKFCEDEVGTHKSISKIGFIRGITE
jgi:AAA+ superfamily predicted ATPase